MSDPILERTYETGIIRVYRAWHHEREEMLLEIVYAGESVEVLALTQEQVRDLLPLLNGFAASVFKPPEQANESKQR